MNFLSFSHYLATSTVQIASQRVDSSWEWYVIRAAGFVSAILLILLMLSGIGQVTGLTYRFIEPVKAWTLHKAMAIALCFSIAVHVLFVLLDKFVPFTLPQVFIPLLSHQNNGSPFAGIALGSLAVTFGILAMYGVAIIVMSSLGWIDSKQKTWRWLHYLGYVVFILVFLHGLYEGTDLRYGTFRAAWLVMGFVIIAAIISRLRRVGTTRKSRDSD